MAAETQAPAIPGYALVCHEEFDRDGPLDPNEWVFERGLVRNHEDQVYTDKNAYCQGGKLIIEARKEETVNSDYDPNGKEWWQQRQKSFYTSASVTTLGKHEFLYGRFEIRARIPTAPGSWPAIWTLGTRLEWPSGGEIDIMEYYPHQGVPCLNANVAWGADARWEPVWRVVRTPIAKLEERDPQWRNAFHVWRMDWDHEAIRIYVDGQLLNEVLLKDTVDGAFGKGANPYRDHPHYLLFSEALGGDNGGKVDEAALPMRLEVDYVRVYQKTGDPLAKAVHGRPGAKIPTAEEP